jgi:hypothetical protein
MNVKLKQNTRRVVETRLPETRNNFSFVNSVEDDVAIGVANYNAFSGSLCQKRNSAVIIDRNFFAVLYIFIIENTIFSLL